MTDANLNYRASSARADSGVGLVILLYEQLVQDLRRAAAAIDSADVEARTLELGHAIEVVGQLQSRLDMQNGGEVAQNLDRFYGSILSGILDAQTKASKAVVLRLVENVLSVREAWLQVERASAGAPATPQAAAVQRTDSQQIPRSVRNWKA
jgi:flagellar protein FliS